MRAAGPSRTGGLSERPKETVLKTVGAGQPRSRGFESHALRPSQGGIGRPRLPWADDCRRCGRRPPRPGVPTPPVASQGLELRPPGGPRRHVVLGRGPELVARRGVMRSAIPTVARFVACYQAALLLAQSDVRGVCCCGGIPNPVPVLSTRTRAGGRGPLTAEAGRAPRRVCGRRAPTAGGATGQAVGSGRRLPCDSLRDLVLVRVARSSAAPSTSTLGRIRSASAAATTPSRRTGA